MLPKPTAELNVAKNTTKLDEKPSLFTFSTLQPPLIISY